METVNILWVILLVVTVLVLPFVIHLLHRTWRAAKSIEKYFSEMKTAGVGVANNTENISGLNETIEVSTTILKVATNIDTHASTLKTALAERSQSTEI